MTSEIHREALLRQTKKKELVEHPVKIEDGYVGRSLQIFEVTELLEAKVVALKWFCIRTDKLSSSDNLRRNLSLKLFSGLNLSIPFTGLVNQMIFYICTLSIPDIENQFRNKTLTIYLSMLIWILCTSDINQLLTFLFGLYDTDNNNVLDIDSICALLLDMFVNINERDVFFQGSHNNSPYNEIQVEEILEDLFDYSDARAGGIFSTSCSIISFDSEDSYDNVVSPCANNSPDMKPPKKPTTKPNIHLDVFLAYFTKRRKSALSPLLQFQLQMQKMSFGLHAWASVSAMCSLQLISPLGTGTGLPLHSYLVHLSQDIVCYLSSQITETDSRSPSPARKSPNAANNFSNVPPNELELQELRTVSQRFHIACENGEASNIEPLSPSSLDMKCTAGTLGDKKFSGKLRRTPLMNARKLSEKGYHPHHQHLTIPRNESNERANMTIREMITFIFGI